MTMGRSGGMPEVLPWVVLLLLGTSMLWPIAAASDGGVDSNGGTAGEGEGRKRETLRGIIAFATLGRSQFDLFGVKLPDFWMQDSSSIHSAALDEIRLTDGVSTNYNGQLVEGEGRLAVLERVRRQGANVADESTVLVFSSERDGSARIYFQIFSDKIQTTLESEIILKLDFSEQPRREALETEILKSGSAVLDAGLHSDGLALFDRPSVVGDSIVFVSTQEARESPRQSWTAVYSTSLKTQITTRLTPKGVADFSPAVSPAGKWVAVASSTSGFNGEEEELSTDLYVCNANDGSDRLLLVKHAGWPSWADDRTIFFHRQADDGWFSVFRIILPEKLLATGEGVVHEERITPPGVHAMTPAASRGENWVAVATRRPGSRIRHVEIFDLVSQSFTRLTENISPNADHYNPFVSSHSDFIGYHRCPENPGEDVKPNVEEVRSPSPGLAVVRVDGTFPSFSKDGSLLAFVRDVGDVGIWVTNVNGSGARKVFSGSAFSTAWGTSKDGKRKNVLYAAGGPPFGTVNDRVDIFAWHNIDGDGEIYSKQLTKISNNGFPSASPDGKYVVFRSLRSGYKNLYIMDAEDGEDKELRRLTEGPWTDQHPNWSPSGEWIAFTSDRENPGAETFAIYMIHPDGTGLHKVLESVAYPDGTELHKVFESVADHSGALQERPTNSSGLTVHPIFSPDNKNLLFVSDYAGSSYEPISKPFMLQPYGQIFIANVDGSNVQRLTHTTWEDGTANWGPSFVPSSDMSKEGLPSKCDVLDDIWLDSEVNYPSKQYSFRGCPYKNIRRK